MIKDEKMIYKELKKKRSGAVLRKRKKESEEKQGENGGRKILQITRRW